MKKTPFLIAIPAIAAAVAIGVAVVLKLVNPAPPQEQQVQAEFPNAIGNSSVEKPTSTLSSRSADDLSSELNDIVDDGGESDFNSLQKDASASGL